jgi:hypothetical protein
MPAFLAILLEIIVLFFVAWFCFWLIDHIGQPNNFPPIGFILKLIVVLIFLGVVLGMFGAFGASFHPALFPRYTVGNSHTHGNTGDIHAIRLAQGNQRNAQSA